MFDLMLSFAPKKLLNDLANFLDSRSIAYCDKNYVLSLALTIAT